MDDQCAMCTFLRPNVRHESHSWMSSTLPVDCALDEGQLRFLLFFFFHQQTMFTRLGIGISPTKALPFACLMTPSFILSSFGAGYLFVFFFVFVLSLFYFRFVLSPSSPSPPLLNFFLCLHFFFCYIFFTFLDRVSSSCFPSARQSRAQ